MKHDAGGGSALLRPSATNLNRNTNFLKVIAMVTMLTDHMGKMLFPAYPLFRIIGRIAFPIYAYCIAVGCIYTKDIFRYARRLALAFLISQPLYALALNHTNNTMYAFSFAASPVKSVLWFFFGSFQTPSILLTLLVSVLLIWTIREKQPVWFAVMTVLLWYLQNHLDYGLRGVILIVLFYLLAAHPRIAVPVIAVYMLWWGFQYSGYTLPLYRVNAVSWLLVPKFLAGMIGGAEMSGFSPANLSYGMQLYAVFALIPIAIPMRSNLKLPKMLFYAFYPAHLLLIILLMQLV